MKVTGKDALALMRHGKDNSARLWCICSSGSSEVRLVGRVAGLSESALLITGTACEARISLAGVSYDYHGSRDIPTAIQESFKGARLRSGDTVIFAEIRTAASPADRPH